MVRVKGAHLRIRTVIFMVYFVTLPLASFGGQIEKFVYNNDGYGTYSFEYKTSDGTYRREDGTLISKPEGRSLVVRGEYGYIDPKGQHHSMKYIADTNGFQPSKVKDDHTRFNDRRIV